jgi:CheY-like chemotaxis protein
VADDAAHRALASGHADLDCFAVGHRHEESDQRVSICPSAADALGQIEGGAIDAALVDLFLGKEDGRTVTDALAAREVPFAIMTGSTDLDRLQRQFPGVPILTKPFTRDEVTETIEKLC